MPTAGSALPLAGVLGTWAAGVRLEAIPEPVLAVARRSVVDTLGVAVAGMRHPLLERLREHAVTVHAAGPCRLLGDPRRLAPAGAALANTATAHVLDYDDTCYAGMCHGSALVLPVVLALAEARGRDGAETLAAFVAGSEVAYAVGHATGFGPFFKGYFQTSVLGAIGAAAAAARLIRLSPGDTAVALAHAAIRARGLRALLGTSAKPVLAGEAAAAGVAAALLAEAGFDAPIDVFEHRHGFAAVVCDGRFDGDAARRVGESWSLLDPGIALKLYPLCSATQAAAEVVEDLLRRHAFAGAEVERVVCEVPPLVDVSLPFARPRSPVEAQFSMPFAVGCLLAFGRLGPDMLDPEVLQAPELATAMARVEMRALPPESAESRALEPEGARVTLTLADGREWTEHRPLATGMPELPMPESRLHEKFLACCAGRVEDPPRLLELARSLDRLPSVVPLLAAIGGGAGD
jgi:2-methylcitrate dehydratase PrpD